MNEHIKLIRYILNFTQIELSNRTGITVKDINDYESGKKEPTDTITTLICSKLGFNETWFKSKDSNNDNMYVEIDDKYINNRRKLYKIQNQISDFIIENYVEASNEDKRLFEEKFMAAAEYDKQFNGLDIRKD